MEITKPLPNLPVHETVITKKGAPAGSDGLPEMPVAFRASQKGHACYARRALLRPSTAGVARCRRLCLRTERRPAVSRAPCSTTPSGSVAERASLVIFASGCTNPSARDAAEDGSRGPMGHVVLLWLRPPPLIAEIFPANVYISAPGQPDLGASSWRSSVSLSRHHRPVTCLLAAAAVALFLVALSLRLAPRATWAPSKA